MMAGTVHLLYFYPLMIVNLGLLALVGSLWFPPGLLFFLATTLLSGMAGVVQGTDTMSLLLKSLLGIWLSAVYACAFLRYMRFNVRDCLTRFALAAYYVALFAVLAHPFMVHRWGAGYRLVGIEIEPGEFCVVCLPAMYTFADQWQRGYGGGKKLLVMLVAVLLSRSSIGFMGLLVGTYLFSRRYRFGSLGAPVIVGLLGLGIYSLSADFQFRMNDSVAGFRQLDGSDLNPSSFSLLSGAFVATRELMAHPLIGAGVGGISLVNQRYIDDLPGASLLPDNVRLVASGDGGSLLFRLEGETGLLGLALAFGFLWYCYPRQANVERQQTAMALLVYCFAKLLRSGSYFNPEVLFLFTLYAVNGSHVLHEVRRGVGMRWKGRQQAEAVRMLPTGHVPG